jgi:hypothetical protein
MTDTKTQGETLNLNAEHHSDGSELIPAEVQAHIRHNDAPSIDDSASAGYTIDNEGLLNNFAIEPKLSAAEYPDPQQQRRYIFLGAGAALFILLLILVATIAS